MATRQGLIDRLRLEMADFTYAFQATFEGDDVTTRLDLPHDNISELQPVSVYLQSDPGTLLTSPAQYLLDARNGWLILTTPIPSGERLVVDGYYSELFSDDQLGVFIDTSFALHSNNTTLTMSTLPAAEEYMVILLAKSEAIWVMVTDAAYDIDIRTVEGVSVPRSQRFAQLMALSNGLKMQYEKLAASLNVGPYRIEVTSLRRKSRMTNRYVPIYIEREVDDINPPLRVYPPIDKRGAQPVPRDAAEFNLVIDRGIPFSKEFTFSDSDDVIINLSSHEFRAQVRPDVFTTKTVHLEFDIDTTNAVDGILVLSLDEDETLKLAQNQSYGWDIQWKPPAGEWDTQIRGVIFAVEEESR